MQKQNNSNITSYFSTVLQSDQILRQQLTNLLDYFYIIDDKKNFRTSYINDLGQEYTEVIKRSIDLDTIKEKIADFRYLSIENFLDEINLMFCNFLCFLPDYKDEFAHTKKLQELF